MPAGAPWCHLAIMGWLTRDPIENEGGVNLYQYVGGRAVISIDPSGLIDLKLHRTGTNDYYDQSKIDFPDSLRGVSIGAQGHTGEIADDGGVNGITRRPKELAVQILIVPSSKRKLEKAEYVKVYACSTGKGPGSFGAQLAVELARRGMRKEVNAPESNVQTSPRAWSLWLGKSHMRTGVCSHISRMYMTTFH